VHTTFLVYLFQLLYMFRATMCPSTGEITLSMQHWYCSLRMGGCLVCWLGWDWVAVWNADQQSRQPHSLIPTSTPESHTVSSQPAHHTATQSHPNQHTRQPPSLIPTSTPDSHTVSFQPAHQTATQSHPNQHTRQPPSLIPTNIPDSHPVSFQPTDQTATHTEWKITVSHRYIKFSWRWAHSCPKHVEKLK